MFQKNIIYYQSSAQSPLKLTRPPKHWGRKTVGEVVKAEGRVGLGFGEGAISPPAHQLWVWGAL